MGACSYDPEASGSEYSPLFGWTADGDPVRTYGVWSRFSYACLVCFS
jgi:hypothetical protein